jgi:hypothetical protein
MAITQLQSQAQGTPGNMTGADIATAVNAVIDLAESAGVGEVNADFSMFIQGVPGDSDKIITIAAVTAFTLPAGLTGSGAYAEVVSTAAAIFDIKKNGGASLGTVNFALGANVATFTFATPTAFAIGDRLSLTNQATADATLADIAITIRGDL